MITADFNASEVGDQGKEIVDVLYEFVLVFCNKYRRFNFNNCFYESSF